MHFSLGSTLGLSTTPDCLMRDASSSLSVRCRQGAATGSRQRFWNSLPWWHTCAYQHCSYSGTPLKLWRMCVSSSFTHGVALQKH